MNIKSTLEWETLEKRRKKLRLLAIHIAYLGKGKAWKEI